MECKICHESHPDLDHVLRHVHPAHGLLPAQYVTIFDCNTEQGNNNKPEKLNSESQSVKMDPDLIVAEDELNFHHLLPKHPLPPEAIETRVVFVNQEQPPRVEAAVRLDSKPPRMEVETQNETSGKMKPVYKNSTVCKVMNAHLGH